MNYTGYIRFRYVLLFFLQLVFLLQVSAQKQLYFGLPEKQPASTLPVSKAPFQVPVLKPRSGQAGVAVPLGNATYALHTGWELTDDLTNLLNDGTVFNENISSKGWYDAVVPGTVLTSLVADGVYPDPYFGLNNLAITDSLCRKIWWYRTSFESPQEKPGKLAWLCLNGINYKAKLWLNGVNLGSANGAFCRGIFNVTSLLKKRGRNVLLVQIEPPHNPGIPEEQSALSGMGKNGGILTADGPTFFATEGWDWIPGIRDRNMGIWQDVQLRYTGTVTATDPYVITDLPLPDTSSAMLSLRTELVNHSSVKQDAIVRFSFEGVSVQKQVELLPGQTLPLTINAAEYPQLLIQNPRLWWPNGYGLPNLYQATITVTDVNGLEDISQFRFGIREYSYGLMADTEDKKALRFTYSPTDIQNGKPVLNYASRRLHADRVFIPALNAAFPLEKATIQSDTTNPYLVIHVNGQPVFCKGGNWGIDDAMKRISREKMEPAFQLHRQANFNLIRNWTGESTEPVFFELADEYGMMVWNDFWISTEGFNLNPADNALLLANSLDVIRRYRSHASIAIWCPRNEGYAPPGIENKLAMQIATADGTRHYHGNSREINLRPSGPWHFFKDNKDYFTRLGEGFTTEIGTFSVPEAGTIRKFMAPEDQWPVNDVWHYHDLHINNQNLEGYLSSADSLYGSSVNLDDFNRKIQLINYESHRAIFEAWNSRLWDKSSGVLLWMSHPAWPSMIWQTYSWDFQAHGSYYGAKKGCEPIHVQLNPNDNQVMVVNTSLHAVEEGTVVLQVFGPDGKQYYSIKKQDGFPANAKTVVLNASFDESTFPANYLIRLTLKDKKGNALSVNEYWKANKSTGNFKAFNQLPVVELSCNASPAGNNQIRIELRNKTRYPAIGVRMDALDNTGQCLLPAFFSESYFTLLPGEQKVIYLETAAIQAVSKISLHGYNLNSITDIKTKGR